MTGLSTLMRGAVLAAGLTALGIGAQAAEVPKVSNTDLCPANLSSLASGVGTVVSCWCPDSTAGGSVWGTGPYTVDSALCKAAVHAGTVPAGGGAIWVRITKGEASYAGSTANGVTTSSYGAYGASIIIAARSSTTAAACPATMQGQSGAVKCSCSASAAGGGGPVWGTDIYTEDSAVCRAAVHAGAIGANGGTVSIVTVGGQQKYVGSTRNGVKTDDYGPWGASYMFTN